MAGASKSRSGSTAYVTGTGCRRPRRRAGRAGRRGRRRRERAGRSPTRRRARRRVRARRPPSANEPASVSSSITSRGTSARLVLDRPQPGDPQRVDRARGEPREVGGQGAELLPRRAGAPHAADLELQRVDPGATEPQVVHRHLQVERCTGRRPGGPRAPQRARVAVRRRRPCRPGAAPRGWPAGCRPAPAAAGRAAALPVLVSVARTSRRPPGWGARGRRYLTGRRWRGVRGLRGVGEEVGQGGRRSPASAGPAPATTASRATTGRPAGAPTARSCESASRPGTRSSRRRSSAYASRPGTSPSGTQATSLTSTSSSDSVRPCTGSAATSRKWCTVLWTRRPSATNQKSITPSLPSTRPRMPVSSATSRTAVSVSVSPASTCPLGSDQSRRPRRSSRPIRAAERRCRAGRAPGRRRWSRRPASSAAGPGGRRR